jgi:hypothetical protein
LLAACYAANVANARLGYSMIPKSGGRFLEKIMLKRIWTMIRFN